MTATEVDILVGESDHCCIARDSTPEEVVKLVYEQYGPILRKFAASLLNGNWDRAEDILQEAAIRAWLQVKERPDAELRLYSWLKTVVRNLVMDEHRARRSRPNTVEITDEYTMLQTIDHMDLLINRAALAEALEKISLPHQEVIRQVYLYDRSTLEVSKALDIPPGTVKSRTFHALRALRSVLSTWNESAP